MLERLFVDLVQHRGVIDTTLFESDGFVLYTSSKSDHRPLLSQFEDCRKAMRTNDSMTLVMEEGYVLLRNTPLGILSVTCERAANLGSIRLALDAISWT
jgi:predicted regulator of Ras-like GTPase activity (Roadblock/LC7/MglB family)